MEKSYVIVVFSKNHELIHESAPFAEYPPEEAISFGLGFPNVAYAVVETRYRKGDTHEQIQT